MFVLGADGSVTFSNIQGLALFERKGYVGVQPDAKLFTFRKRDECFENQSPLIPNCFQ